MHRRALGYARVSSAEQAIGTSLQDQQDVIRAHAAKRGLRVERMYVEAESAVHEKVERREQMRALMTDARAGDLVLVDKIDRWSRDPEFAYRSIRELHERGASFYAIGDDCDPSTPHGDSMLGLRVFFAREEHKRIRLRLVGTRKLLRDRGYYVEGLPPWGYRRAGGRGAERNVLVVQADEAELVREAFRLCIAGSSITQIAATLGVYRDRVVYGLRNRAYLGEVRDSAGHWISGRHEAIVDAALFEGARQALERRRRGERRTRDDSETAAWWLRDIARCALCSAKMSAAYAGPHNARRYYFRCYAQCTTRFVPVRRAEAEADPLVLARLEELRDLLEAAGPVAPPIAKVDVDGRRQRLQARRARLLDAYADGHMTRDELSSRMAKLDDERTALDAMVQTPREVRTVDRRRAFRDVQTMRRAWLKLDGRGRRKVVAALASAVFLARAEHGLTIRFEWFSAEFLARGAE